jgi:hypothetical protein
MENPELKHYSVLPAEAHTEDCDFHETAEQPATVELWLHKGEDGVDVMVVFPDESIEWLNDLIDGGTIAYEKKESTGLLIRFGYTPTSEWQVMDQFGDELTRTFKLIDAPESAA